MIFVPTGYAPFEISFIALYDKVDTSLFMENGIWILTDTHVEAGILPQGIQYLTATFHIKRRASFYLVNLLLPISTMGVLNLLVFLLPANSGERVGYCITLLLAIAVFLTIAAEHLPKTSYPTISILSIKLLADMTISGLGLFFTIVGLRFYHADGKSQVPGCIAAMSKVLICKCCCKRKREKRKYRISTFCNRVVHSSADYESSSKTNMVKINSGITKDDFNDRKDDGLHRIEINHDGNEKGFIENTSSETITWNDVGKASDVLFFCLSLVASVASHTAYFIYSQQDIIPPQD